MKWGLVGGREGREQGAGESPKSRGEGKKRGDSKGWRAAPLLTGWGNSYSIFALNSNTYLPPPSLYFTLPFSFSLR